MDVFYPSCNFARISPKAAKRMRSYMAEVLSVPAGGKAAAPGTAARPARAAAFSPEKPIAICCLREKRELQDGDTGLYICQSCREHIQGGTPESLWAWLLERDDFDWPSYEGPRVVVQDCWRDREHPEVHAAVREALERMGVAWTEPEDARERSTFCGTRHVEPRTPRQRELMAGHPDFYVRTMPEEVQRELMAERVRELEALAPVIVTDCNACTQGLELGGGNVVHLGELVMGTYEPAAEAAGDASAA